jgi:DNA polymerase III gamma/tau subunit
MEINQVITKIKSESHGFYIIETSSFNLDAIEECIKNSFYEKQYEIDTSFINLAAEDGTKHISIEQIRKLKREFLHTNVLNISRVILISEINTLNNNSINALLKLIEEIPSNTFFIFCTV